MAATLKDIKYFNTQSKRTGNAIECLKPDFIKRNMDYINNAIRESDLHCNSVIQIVFFPKRQDLDFIWRTTEKKYMLTVTDKNNTFYSKILK